jgi:hypothetical protein
VNTFLKRSGLPNHEVKISILVIKDAHPSIIEQMSLDQVPIRIVNSVATVAETGERGAQGCEEYQNNGDKLFHKTCAREIATILQKSAIERMATWPVKARRFFRTLESTDDFR